MKVIVPELGESVLEATVARWLKKAGERVAAGEALVELETDKVNVEVSAQEEGVLARIDRQEGEDVKVGDILGELESPGSTRPQEKRAEAPGSQAGLPGKDGEQGAERATPVARRLAQDLGVDLAQVSGSGPRERVTTGDVRQYLERAQTPAPAGEPGQPPALPPTPTPAFSPQPAQPTQPRLSTPVPSEEVSSGRREARVRMSRRRRTIAARLVEAQHTAAMLTTFNDVDCSAVMEIRSRRKDAFLKRHAVKLGFMSFFVKAAVGALKDFPNLNAEIQGDEIVLKEYYDIGMAVGSPEGLVVPVIRDAGRLSFAEIEKKIQEMVQKVESGALSVEDLRGGTFTITNGGVFGSLLSTPILNPPQVGILGLHRIENRPVAVDGRVEIRPMMYLALSYDHRIVDGREAVQFLVRVKELIQDPETLFLEV